MNRKHLLISALVVLAALLLQIAYRAVTGLGGNDMKTAMCGAQMLLARGDPYACRWEYNGAPAAPYPMTTVLFFLPFAALDAVGAILLWSLSAGLLTYAIITRGKPWQLLIVTCAPFWISAYHLQFTVLLAAVFLLPDLLPLAIVKPQSALALFGIHLTRRRLIGTIAFLALTFAVLPDWPIRWLVMARTYDGFIPALVFPTCLIFVPALLAWKNRHARFLLLTAISPQRWIYDTLTVWLLARSPYELLTLSGLSWIVYYLTASVFAATGASSPEQVLMGIYMPASVFLALGHFMPPPPRTTSPQSSPTGFER